MSKTVFSLIIILLIFSGCGLFSPNQPEIPVERTPGNLDSFNFEQIISNIRIHFSDLEYTELFYDSDSLYESSNNRKKFDKDRFLDHLDHLERLENDNNYSMVISWIPDSTRDSIGFGPRDTVSINPTYRVWFTPDNGEERYFEARSTFRLIFHQNRWVIFTFKDGFAGQSIFHPEYQAE